MVLAGALATAQHAGLKKKHILVIGQTKGFQHDSVPDAMGSIWKMGMDSDLWTTYMRTDTELITKGKVGGEREEPGLFRPAGVRQHDR